MKIASNSPVWDFISFHSPATRIVTEVVHSTERSSIHPITALPRAGKEGGECGKKERGGGMGDGDPEGRDVATRMSSELWVLFEKPFRNDATKELSSFTPRNI